MTDLIAARSQMAMSLGFHIIFAAVGIAMPLMMVIAEWRWMRTGRDVYLVLAKRWAQGTAILFAVGAVSGTVLSFELGLLWPAFMAKAGPAIGLLFSLEGFAFFAEAIFLGIYLFGWQRVSRWAHLASGIVVAASGLASGIFVVIANAWMNTPTGFRLVEGQLVDIDPIAAMGNPMAFTQTLHMILATYAATGFAVAGIHAFLLLRDRKNPFHQQALSIALFVGGIAAILQPLSGDILARAVAEHQPVKLAAFEGQFRTQSNAPLHLGGIPDIKTGTMRYSIDIPSGLSVLLYQDPQAVVVGLEDFPRDQWPPVAIVHIAFQIMVAAGLVMVAVSLWGAWLLWRRGSVFNSKPFLRAVMVASPLGFVAIESGWVVTEVGRQPWIISGVMRTAEAVTPMRGLTFSLATFTILFIFLGIVVLWLLRRQVLAGPHGATLTHPSPPEAS